MNEYDLLGNWSLLLALVVCGLGAAAAVLAAWKKSSPLLDLSRSAVYGAALLLTLASIRLLLAFLNNEFRIEYVASYSERAMPVGYKIAAFWAGQNGSLLLWAWLVGVLASLAAWWSRRDPGRQQAVLLGVLLVATGYFLALLRWAMNPFELLPQSPIDGNGMNPLLQDMAMILHPPLLFVGYAGYTVPLALTAAALACGGGLDVRWLNRVRQWNLASWIFLTAGIVLGAQWAYIELGWGGYWGWDPVENASLLPWFTSTALLHTLIIQRYRDRMKWWNTILIALSFLLCLFATYLTRSGVIASVHAFGQSNLGWFFLGFMGVALLAWGALLGWRHEMHRARAGAWRLWSRESFVWAGAALLMLMLLGVLLGTMYPLISALFSKTPITQGPSFYNTLIVPMGFVMAVVMAVAPLLPLGKAALPPRRLAVTLGAGVVALLIVAAVTLTQTGYLAALTRHGFKTAGWDRLSGALWLGGAAGIVTVAIVAAVWELVLATMLGEAAFRARQRRVGALSAHVGLALAVLGLAGSAFAVKSDTSVDQGQSISLGGYTLRYDAVRMVRGANYAALEADIALISPDGSTRTLRPQKRIYHKHPDKPNSEVDVRSTPKDDVYVSLLGWDPNTRQIGIHAMVHPLVIWIWLGSALLMLAALGCLLVVPLASPGATAGEAQQAQSKDLPSAS